MNGSPSGDDVFGQPSPAAKTDEIYSTFDKTTTTLSRSTQASFSANWPSFFSLPDVAAAASYLLGPEVGKPPGGGDEKKWRE